MTIFRQTFIMDLSDDKCECGGKACGYGKYQAGHSNWCKWHPSNGLDTGVAKFQANQMALVKALNNQPQPVPPQQLNMYGMPIVSAPTAPIPAPTTVAPPFFAPGDLVEWDTRPGVPTSRGVFRSVVANTQIASVDRASKSTPGHWYYGVPVVIGILRYGLYKKGDTVDWKPKFSGGNGPITRTTVDADQKPGTHSVTVSHTTKTGRWSCTAFLDELTPVALI